MDRGIERFKVLSDIRNSAAVTHHYSALFKFRPSGAQSEPPSLSSSSFRVWGSHKHKLKHNFNLKEPLPLPDESAAYLVGQTSQADCGPPGPGPFFMQKISSHVPTERSVIGCQQWHRPAALKPASWRLSGLERKWGGKKNKKPVVEWIKSYRSSTERGQSPEPSSGCGRDL